MTKTGLENKRLRTDVQMQERKLGHEAREGMMNRGVSVANAAIGALGRQGAKFSFGGKNDPAWYKQLPAGAQVSTSLPTWFPNGQSVKGIDISSTYITSALPTVLVMYYHNVWGDIVNQAGVTQPASMLTINLAASRLMTIARSFNSRIGQYEPADFLQFILGEVEVIRMIVRLTRALDCYRIYDSFNPGIRQELIEACGFDWDDFESHIKDYEGWIIPTIEYLNANVVVPNDFPYLHRKLYLDKTVFREGDGDNAQFVLFQPLEYHVYDENNARLLPYDIDGKKTFAGFIANYSNALNAIQNTSVFKELVADIRDAARNGLKLFTLPVYSRSDKPNVKPMDEVLWQTMNASLLPNISVIGTCNEFSFTSAVAKIDTVNDAGDVAKAIPTTSSAYIYHLIHDHNMWLKQDSNGFLIPTNDIAATSAERYAVSLPNSTGTDVTGALNNFNGYMVASDKLLNFYKNDVSGDDIMEATRLLNRWRFKYAYDAGTSQYTYGITAEIYSTEILCYGIIMSGKQRHDRTTLGLFITNDSLPVMAFNYRPTVFYLTGSSNTTLGFYPVQQWDKVVSLEYANLYILHDVATKSLFTIASDMSHK